MIPLPATQFKGFFLIKAIDNSVSFVHQFTASFQKHLHKLTICTLSFLILTTYTENHVGKKF